MTSGISKFNVNISSFCFERELHIGYILYVVFWKVIYWQDEWIVNIMIGNFVAISRHYSCVIMSGMPSQTTSLTIVYSTVDSGADQRKYQSSASLAFVRGIHQWPVNSRTKSQYRGKCFHLMTSLWPRQNVLQKETNFLKMWPRFIFSKMIYQKGSSGILHASN